MHLEGGVGRHHPRGHFGTSVSWNFSPHFVIGAMGDPSESELASIATLGDAANRVGLSGTDDDLLTPRGSFFIQLGVNSSTNVAILATFTQAEFNALVTSWSIATAMDTNGAVTAQRAPTIAEVGMGRLTGRICRRCIGTEPQVSPTASPSPKATSSATSRKIKLNQVVSQVDETEIEPLSEADLLIMFARYEALFGKGQRPPNNREPTSEQLAALRSLIASKASNQVPYADFAIFSSYGTRIQKKLRFQGLTFEPKWRVGADRDVRAFVSFLLEGLIRGVPQCHDHARRC